MSIEIEPGFTAGQNKCGICFSRMQLVKAQIHNIQSCFLMYVIESVNLSCFIHVQMQHFVPLTQTCTCTVQVKPVIFLEMSYI